MLPATAGALPGNVNMMSSPREFSSFLFPDRNPSPRPTSNSNDPTPQAIPNMVRNERSLCAQRVRNICRRISKNSIAGLQPPPNAPYECRRQLVPLFLGADDNFQLIH